jgi:hypothetical protein
MRATETTREAMSPTLSQDSTESFFDSVSANFIPPFPYLALHLLVKTFVGTWLHS